MTEDQAQRKICPELSKALNMIMHCEGSKCMYWQPEVVQAFVRRNKVILEGGCGLVEIRKQDTGTLIPVLAPAVPIPMSDPGLITTLDEDDCSF